MLSFTYFTGDSMKSIRWKLVFMYLSLVFMVLILTGTYIVISTENREKNKAKRQYALPVVSLLLN